MASKKAKTKIKIKGVGAYSRHHVELERHGDHIETDDTGDDEIEVFAVANVVQESSRSRIARIIRNFAHFYQVSNFGRMGINNKKNE